MATLQPIRCVDDCGNVPARVEHAPALLLNCEADSLLLLSATAARLQRLIHGHGRVRDEFVGRSYRLFRPWLDA